MGNFIEIKGDLSKIERFKRKNPADNVAKEIAQRLVEETKSTAPYWKGNLQKSIQSRQTKNGYNIWMNYYARGLEEGHTIQAGLQPLMLKWWSREKFGLELGQAFMTRLLFHSFTAKAHPFIQPSIDKVMKDFDNISFQVLNKTKKEVGI